MVTGERSVAFWEAHAEHRAELRAQIIQDAGHDVTDPPRALELAADNIAQAVLIRDSAFSRMVESGGPLTSSGRARRSFEVWQKALDRVEKHLRLVGLERKAQPTQTLAEYLNEREKEGGDDGS